MSKRADVMIAPLEDKAELSRLITGRWGADVMVMGGMRYTSATVSAFAAHGTDGKLLGFATWVLRGTAVCILSLDSLTPGGGIGRLLIEAVMEAGRKGRARSIRVMTTNDNTAALVYYQRRGFHLTALYAGAIDAYRAMNPGLRPVGFHGIPVRDSIELEMDL